MPILGKQLKAGDILFKHADKSAISQQIAKGQSPHYDHALWAVNVVPFGGKDFATGLTHVAMAVGPDDVMEFDEGGASLFQIIFQKGYGFVRGGMKLDSRKGFRYEVYRSNNEELGPAAGDKAELLWDTVQQSGGSASYSVGKMLGTALLHWKGKKYKTVEDFEEQFDAWVKEGSDMNIRFFCSHFVTFCYHWAAKDIGHTGVFGFDYTIGANKVKISPAELYVRVDQMGLSHFQHKGTLYAH